METERKKHWETVYETKGPDEVSWTQEVPQTSLDFINSFQLNRSAKIIDIGGGDSKLVDCLLEQGYENISVLDISAKALEKAKKRLGANAQKVNWIVCDITEFKPETTYEIWHDRAAFHFLTEDHQIERYLEIVGRSVSKFMVIGTFSENGPLKCSGLDIKQYSELTLSSKLSHDFEKLQCMNEDHKTPFQTTQNFLFCSFKRK